MICYPIEQDLADDADGEPTWIGLYAQLAIGRLEKLLRLHAEFDEWLRDRL